MVQVALYSEQLKRQSNQMNGINSNICTLHRMCIPQVTRCGATALTYICYTYIKTTCCIHDCSHAFQLQTTAILANWSSKSQVTLVNCC